jgi:hypothetical protein
LTSNLSQDEKRLIVKQYGLLRAAIDDGYAEDDVAVLAVAFQRVYLGDSRPLVDAFGAAEDKADWARQVRARLAEEIGGEHWPSPVSITRTGDARTDVANGSADPGGTDELSVAALTCEHCGQTFEVRVSPMPGAALVTEHPVACPVCGRITEQSLPGSVVGVVRSADSTA